jgi:threonine/homoserine/homoserine lactone efflux protein
MTAEALVAFPQLAAFVAASVAVTVSPGPDNLMVLGLGMSRGRAAGIAFGLGCGLGCLSHTLLAVVGVGALVAASPLAFTLLRVAGGLYLAWLGLQCLRSRGGSRVPQAEAGGPGLRALFLRGVMANAINPKVILFFLSFLPQFVSPRGGPVSAQLAVLGVVFTAQAALLFALLGAFAGTVGQWLNRRPAAGLWLDRIAGLIFIGLGLRLIVAG